MHVLCTGNNCVTEDNFLSRCLKWTIKVFYYYLLIILDMRPLAAASRSRLLETEPKVFVFETSYYAFCGRYCFESVASKIK